MRTDTELLEKMIDYGLNVEAWITRTGEHYVITGPDIDGIKSNDFRKGLDLAIKQSEECYPHRCK